MLWLNVFLIIIAIFTCVGSYYSLTEELCSTSSLSATNDTTTTTITNQTKYTLISITPTHWELDDQQQLQSSRRSTQYKTILFFSTLSIVLFVAYIAVCHAPLFLSIRSFEVFRYLSQLQDSPGLFLMYSIPPPPALPEPTLLR